MHLCIILLTCSCLCSLYFTHFGQYVLWCILFHSHLTLLIFIILLIFLILLTLFVLIFRVISSDVAWTTATPLYVVDVQNSALAPARCISGTQKLTAGGHSHPLYSPDGKYIAYISWVHVSTIFVCVFVCCVLCLCGGCAKQRACACAVH